MAWDGAGHLWGVCDLDELAIAEKRGDVVKSNGRSSVVRNENSYGTVSVSVF